MSQIAKLEKALKKGQLKKELTKKIKKEEAKKEKLANVIKEVNKREKFVPTAVKDIEKKINIDTEIRELLKQFKYNDDTAYKIFLQETSYNNPETIWDEYIDDQKYPYRLKSIFYIKYGTKYNSDSKYYDFVQNVLNRLVQYHPILQKKFIENYLAGDDNYKTFFQNWKSVIDKKRVDIQKNLSKKTKGKVKDSVAKLLEKDVDIEIEVEEEEKEEEKEDDVEEEDEEGEHKGEGEQISYEIEEKEQKGKRDEILDEVMYDYAQDETDKDIAEILFDIENVKTEKDRIRRQQLYKIYQFTLVDKWKKDIDTQIREYAIEQNIEPSTSILQNIKNLALKLKTESDDFERELENEDGFTVLEKNIINDIRKEFLFGNLRDLSIEDIYNKLEKKYGDLSKKKEFFDTQIMNAVAFYSSEPKRLINRFSEEYIAMAEQLGVENPKDLPLSVLLSSVSNRLKALISKLGVDISSQILDMSKENLEEELKQTDDNIDILRIKLLKKRLAQKPSYLIRRATEEGIIDPQNYDDVQLLDLIREKLEEKRLAKKTIYEGAVKLVELPMREQIKIPVNIMNARCVFYDNFKWIPGKVTSVWLDDKKFSTGESIITSDNKRFYKAGRSFYNLQCNVYADLRSQQGNKLIAYVDKNTKVEFKVAFTIINPSIDTSLIVKESFDINNIKIANYIGQKVLLQNEDIFNREKAEWIKKNIYDEKKLTDIGERNIDKNSILIAKKWLSNFLIQCTDNRDYSVDSPFIHIAIDSIKNVKTNKELFRKVAEIIVYTMIKEAQIFRKRLKAEYYLPEILHQITHVEKFPEVYDPLYGTSQNSIDVYSSYIQNNIDIIIQKMLGDFLVKDPTRKKVTDIEYKTHPEMINYEDKKLCVNDIQDIDPKNIIYYQDEIDKKLYCFDVVKLALNFEKGDYINPFTNNPFSQEFVRRYTITYFDKDDGKTYTFPFESLYKRFKNNDIVNPQTGRLFDESFVTVVLKGSTFHKSAYLRDLSFKRLDRKLATCANPQDIIYEPPESVLFYEDKKNKKRYCFSIPNLSKILTQGNLNPISGEEFDKPFIDNFNNTYSDALNQGGINQNIFRSKYGQKLFENIPLPVSKEIEEKYEIKIEHKKVPLIIPELWELVSQSVAFYEKKNVKEEKFAFSMTDEETIPESNNTESNNNESNSESNEQEKKNLDLEDDLSDKTESDKTESEKSDPVKTNSNEINQENNQEQITLGFTDKIPKKCHYCKKNIGNNYYRTIIMKKKNPVKLVYCCDQCMDNDDIEVQN
jgi:hypothetical protein